MDRKQKAVERMENKVIARNVKDFKQIFGGMYEYGYADGFNDGKRAVSTDLSSKKKRREK